MKAEQVFAMSKFIADNGAEIEIRGDYSGRGMFGKKTVAFIGDESELVEALGECGIDPKSVRWDQMGKSDLVCY